MRGVLAAVTAVLTLAIAVPASGAERFGSTVTIHWTSASTTGVFYGLVDSKKRACVRNRQMKVLRSDERDTGYSAFVDVPDPTASDGTWFVVIDPVSGWFRALATRKNLPGDAVCRRARSKPLPLF